MRMGELVMIYTFKFVSKKDAKIERKEKNRSSGGIGKWRSKMNFEFVELNGNDNI